MKDLVVLTPGKDDEHALRGILSRPEAIGIRAISVDYFRHPEHDPGCLNNPELILQSQAQLYQFALILFDREGCGNEVPGKAKDLEKKVEGKLCCAGWENRARCVVIEPELEIWVWSDSPHVDEVLGWKNHDPALRQWLKTHGWTDDARSKPSRPKEAFEAALREVRMPRSSSLYESLAMKVSFMRCQDSAFSRLCKILMDWFPRANSETLLVKK